MSEENFRDTILNLCHGKASKKYKFRKEDIFLEVAKNMKLHNKPEDFYNNYSYDDYAVRDDEDIFFGVNQEVCHQFFSKKLGADILVTLDEQDMETLIYKNRTEVLPHQKWELIKAGENWFWI